jgi:hypothetical protein
VFWYEYGELSWYSRVNGGMASESATVDTLVSGIADMKEPDWMLYPNPVSDVIRVFNQNATGKSYTISIFNMVGMKVTESALIQSGSNAATINVGSLAAGTYIVSIVNENGISVYRKKLMKQ